MKCEMKRPSRAMLGTPFGSGGALRLLLVPLLAVILLLLSLRKTQTPREGLLSPPMELIVQEINPESTKYKLVDSTTHNPIPFSTAMDLLAEKGSPLQEELLSELRRSKHGAFFWECPPVTSMTVSSAPFEFVIIAAPRLEGVSPDLRSFSSKFVASEDLSVFPNLGKDALLIVPSPLDSVPQETYTHIANFVRMAPAGQVQNLISRTAVELAGVLKSRPHPHKVWLSTSGLGVYWLHIRIDSVPKYYNWDEYKSG